MNLLNRLAINTAIFDGHDMSESLAMIKTLGVSKVEFAFNQGYVGNLDDSLFSESHADKLIDLLSHNSLSTVALGCTMDMASEQAIESFKTRIRFAEKLGVKYLNTCTTRAEKLDTLVENLKQLAPYAEQNGCVICLENGGDNNFNAISTAAEGIQLLESVGHDAVALNFDPGNTVSLLPGLDPVEQALVALPYCQHFHIKDVVTSPEQYSFPAIGDGGIDYAALLPSLDEKSIPFSFEIPLRMTRQADAMPNRSEYPVSLSDIHNTLRKSIKFIQENIG